jgi:ATP-binding cassette subfamily B protein
MPDRRYSLATIYRRVFAQVQGSWWRLIALQTVILLATPIALLTPLPIKIAVDHAIDGKPLSQSVPGGWLAALVPSAVADSRLALGAAAAVLLIAFTLLGLLQQLSTWLLQEYLGQRVTLNFRARLFRHVQRLSLAYHDRVGTAGSTYVIQYDAPAIQWITIEGIAPYVGALVSLVSMIVVTALISWEMALVALTVCPIVAALTHFYAVRQRQKWRTLKDLESGAMSIIQEVLSALRVVKAFGGEDREQQRFVKQSRATMGHRIRVTFGESSFSVLIGLTTGVGAALVLFFGVRQVVAGQLSTGDLLLVMGYLTQLYGPLQTIGKQITTQQGSLASAERAFALLDEVPDVSEKPDARPLQRARGDLSIEHVSFAYNPDRTILHDVNLHVAPGVRLGIVGRTGAGKSTLINLITRLIDPTQGRVTLDGIDLRDLKLDDLRNQFAIVLQEPVLFSTSIAQNIAYAKPEASMDAIIAAAQAADAHDFIANRLPQGYDTAVGERGLSLSGGERQRIALARAFLKNAPILILDEPTSSVDVKTEASIMDAMGRLMEGRTTLMIAHRLSTLDVCDELVELNGGQVISLDRPAAHRPP